MDRDRSRAVEKTQRKIVPPALQTTASRGRRREARRGVVCCGAVLEGRREEGRGTNEIPGTP